jgi:hypothetical protein
MDRLAVLRDEWVIREAPQDVDGPAFDVVLFQLVAEQRAC